MEPLHCVMFGCVIAVGSPNFAEQQFLFDNASAPESPAPLSSTKGQQRVYDALPDASNPYSPLWQQRRLYDARPGSSSERSTVPLYPDLPTHKGRSHEYGGGMKGYQFDRPPSTFPKERD